MGFRAGAAALCLSFLAGGASAATAFTCKLSETTHSLVPEVLFIGLPDDSNTAQVSDPVVYYFNDNQPVTARVTQRDEDGATFVWRVRGPQTTEFTTITMRYEAKVNLKSGFVSVNARATELRGRLNGRGSCEIEKIND